ncbi:MAG TPA: amino acid ABC transporter substrate-binding protein [Hyphomicrobiaceae bacterium]|jgi:general L-amino acid transport system substrate-binding protein|nr:amino acid ABC transporter substrate-binding protein [Hyphomicrobiaceae bacterium]
MRLHRPLHVLLFFLLAISLPVRQAWAAGVLDKVRARGHLTCGVGDGPAGFSVADAKGNWTGIGADFCRALAAAVFDKGDAVEFRQVPPSDRVSALRSGEIDVLSNHVGMTISRDTMLGIRMPVVLVYDGLGFLVRKSQGISSALELSGARICVATETADEQGATEYFATLKLPVELVKFDRWRDVVGAYANNSCQVLAADLSTLAMVQQGLSDPAEHILLPELASKAFIGPAVPAGDAEWQSVVRWTVYALIAAEELGITQANADSLKTSGGPEAKRFLASSLDFVDRPGLSAGWTLRMVKQVGNYGEIYERTLGAKSALKLPRRLNALAVNGGLMYAPPFR